ncbi:PEP-CTERM sorting domain-containing protein [Aquisalimonas asiatica]|uniref:PEP-CTERM protein-sorting domain-containing protein n=1 Tax=Aquisalimonas asiatica TaxID=406100 RepID=A0A1H8U363_9GAMM|nr:PEP-CTERM sorting domain-containing protein [Aquisalimonas asiatica]SEO97575.1 PEP-CTERM protein-sorting domain-containing protein [Aquisalimonas asiatica]
MMKQMFLAGVVGLASSSAAVAGPFYLDLGGGGGLGLPNAGDPNNSGSTRTQDFNSMGSLDTLATSIYQASSPGDIGPGTPVFDTNRSDVLGDVSITNGSIQTPSDDQRNIAGFVPAASLAGGNGFAASPDDWQGNNWGMTFDYDLAGQVVSGSGDDLNNAAVNFTSGTFDYFFEYEGERLQVLSIDVTGSSGSIANLVLEGRVNFDFLANGGFSADEQDFIQNFFRDAATGDSFYDIASTGAEVPIHWRLDTNVDGDEDLIEGEYQGETVWVRQTELNTTARFQVPEPSAVMLLGLGLVGLAFVAHRRRKADQDLAA